MQLTLLQQNTKAKRLRRPAQSKSIISDLLQVGCDRLATVSFIQCWKALGDLGQPKSKLPNFSPRAGSVPIIAIISLFAKHPLARNFDGARENNARRRTVFYSCRIGPSAEPAHRRITEQASSN
jgi:hypothetical protein